jgi:RNA-splicing ligase RtcB
MNFQFPTKYNEFKIFSPNDRIDQKVFNQILDISNLHIFKDSKIRLMPDFHAGHNSIVGLTMTIDNYIIPNIIGIDLGCSVILRKIYPNKTIDFPKLDKIIRTTIPVGYLHNNFDFTQPDKQNLLNIIKDLFQNLKVFSIPSYEYITNQLGTLGGGNHFIEVDKDEQDQYYLMVHTGSRNIGKAVAQKYQILARKQSNIDETELYSHRLFKGISLAELAYLDKITYPQTFNNYINDMTICQTFSKYNRLQIVNTICKLMDWHYDIHEDIETMHNYLDTKAMILRKGAVSAQENETIVIPLNMKDGALICTGKGNDEWNFSAPHGAGRSISRFMAFKKISFDQYTKSMSGVYTTCLNEYTIDECPLAYKDTDELIKTIAPTVTINNHIKSVFNFKAI